MTGPGPVGPTIPGGPASAAAVLDAGLERHPAREALVGRHGRFTWAELDAEANRAAHALVALGVAPGDRVAMALPNDVDIVIGFLGCMRLGAVWLGCSLALAPPEKAYLLEDSGAAVVLATPAVAAELRDTTTTASRIVAVDREGDRDEWRARVAAADATSLGRSVDPHGPAAIAYTSGTTGRPKGAVHSQHNLLLPGAVARSRAQYRDGDRVGVVLPLTIVNLIALGPLLAWQVGATCVAIDRVDAPGLAGWIRDEQVTTISTVPTIMHDLMTHPGVEATDLASLRVPGVGGADCPDSFRDLYRRRFGAEVTVGYGLTEAPTAVTMTAPDAPAVPGSAGRALPHVRIAVLDEAGAEVAPGEVGEICIGPALDGPWAGVYTPMLGYWNRPAETAAALRGGLLHTGDLGLVDEDGEVYVKDRRHDLVIRGGSNVYPAEVERVLHDDATVAACAVVGRPDDRLGERVVAFVQPADGTKLDIEALRAHCTANLARYKVPEEFHAVDSFERNAMGKIVKGRLRERLRRT
ncbi:MAG TPA: AMP-binding protein [Acidimicrobiia bacterium]|nr:AMP-binding protein [Acidimicrobiia bacterium]